MSRVASVLSESTTRISNGGSCVTKLSSRAEMCNVRRNLRLDKMVSGLRGPEATFNIVSRILARPDHGPHRHDHRNSAGDHQDGPGGQGVGRPVARAHPRPLGPALRPDDGPGLLSRHEVAGAGPPVRVEG